MLGGEPDGGIGELLLRLTHFPGVLSAAGRIPVQTDIRRREVDDLPQEIEFDGALAIGTWLRIGSG